MRRKLLLLMGLAALPILAAPVAALPKAPGAELRVNSTSATSPTIERHPVAAFSAAGNSLVVWEDDRGGLLGRFFGADSGPLSATLTLVANRLPSTLPYQAQVAIQKAVSIAFLPNNQFFLFWTEETDFEDASLFFLQDTLIDHQLFGQKFDGGGRALGDRFPVNTTAAGFQSGARALVRANDLIVTWQTSRNPVFPTNGDNDGIFLRSFDLSGNATSGEIRVSAKGTRANAPAIAGGASGKFVVAYENGDGDGRGVFAQPYTAALTPIGSVVRVNTDTALDQRKPAVAADVAGNYMVAWQGQVNDTKHARVFAQQVGAAGNLIGAQIAVSHGAVQYEVAPSVAAGRTSFLVSWLGYGETFPTGILASSIDRVTGAVSAAIQVNQQPLGANTQSAVAGNGAGAFLLPWEGFVGDNLGISARRLAE
ncbi:MAG TPA: hypothetical protein VFE33_35370 [Thermoanaerobaculia bacterium]|nr:hypothetical protein [Thermoanaerobaculia bacterium]